MSKVVNSATLELMFKSSSEIENSSKRVDDFAINLAKAKNITKKALEISIKELIN